jgi:hypothetical protein
VYPDPSPSASADLFRKLKSYFGTDSKDVSGVGDEAYLDKFGDLHVRKGKVRYFLSGTRDNKKLNDLASGIAATLRGTGEDSNLQPADSSRCAVVLNSQAVICVLPV